MIALLADEIFHALAACMVLYGVASYSFFTNQD
jgi:hypothetical protein